MKFTFTGKNLVVSQDMKDKTEKKISRLGRLFPENAEVFVTFSAVRQDNKVEISVPFNKRLLRAEVTAADMYAAVDGAVDVLDKQMVKYKQRVKDKSRRDGSFKDELNLLNNFTSTADEQFEDDDVKDESTLIERRKHFPLKPMDPEEAVMSMEMLGHSFFVFRNSSTNEINVVYKRKAGTYGLIDPNDPVDED